MTINPFKTSSPYLETAKKLLTDFLTIVGGITAIALACGAAIYTAFWLA